MDKYPKGKLNLEPLIKFIDHMPNSGDVELALLKSHLLIEEVLTHILLKKAQNPQHLKKTQISFSSKATLARCFSDLDGSPWIWTALKKLNSARNSLAHDLDRNDFADKLEDFVSYVETTQGKIDPSLVSEKLSSFHYAVFNLYSALSAYAHFDPAAMGVLTILGLGKKNP